MPTKEFYLVTSLPRLGDLTASPPLSPLGLLESVRDVEPALQAVRAILLSDDLLQREAFLAGEIQAVQPTVLTEAQMRNEAPLPAELATEALGGTTDLLPVDGTLAAYFRFSADLAMRAGNSFLLEWVQMEVSLRNALAAARAAALGLDASRYLVAPELAQSNEDFTAVINQWSAAAHPLEAQRVLDSFRWDWLDRNDRYFTFTLEEVAAYTARLILQRRWQRIMNAQAALPDVPME